MGLKNIIPVVALLSASIPLVSEELPPPGPTRGLALYMANGTESGTGIGRKPCGELAFGYTTARFDTRIGASTNSFSTDAMAYAYAAPLAFRYLDIGLKSFAHYSRFQELGYEYDLSGYLCLTTHSPPPRYRLNLSIAVGIDRKKTVFSEAYGVDIDPIVELFPSFALEAGAILSRRSTLLISMASFDDYYVPLFLAPIFTLEYRCRIFPALTLGLRSRIRYSDMFTLTAHEDGSRIELVAKVQPGRP